MLELKQIASVLSQGLKPVLSTSESTPIAISLLSHLGLPLVTVSTSSEDISGAGEQAVKNNFKVHSLLAVQCLKKEQNGEETIVNSAVEDWTVLEVPELGGRAVIELVFSSKSTPLSLSRAKYVIIFYKKVFGDAVAKLRADNLCRALREGLEGYED